MNPATWTLDQWTLIVAVLSLAATVVCAIVGTLAWLRPRQPLSPPTMDELSGIGSARRTHLPRGVLIWGALTALFFVVTVGLISQLRTMPGPPGPQGIAGPPGPSDPRVSNLINTVKALAEVHYYVAQLSRLQGLKKQYDDSHEQYFKSLTTPQPIMSLGRGFGMMNIMGEGDIISIAKRDFNIEINLHKHPEFDQNHYMPPAPGQEKISNPAIQEDYRRLYDEKQNADDAIQQLISRYQNEINANEHIINLAIPAYGPRM